MYKEYLSVTRWICIESEYDMSELVLINEVDT